MTEWRVDADLIRAAMAGEVITQPVDIDYLTEQGYDNPAWAQERVDEANRIRDERLTARLRALETA